MRVFYLKDPLLQITKKLQNRALKSSVWPDFVTRFRAHIIRAISCLFLFQNKFYSFQKVGSSSFMPFDSIVSNAVTTFSGETPLLLKVFSNSSFRRWFLIYILYSCPQEVTEFVHFHYLKFYNLQEIRWTPLEHHYFSEESYRQIQNTKFVIFYCSVHHVFNLLPGFKVSIGC